MEIVSLCLQLLIKLAFALLIIAKVTIMFKVNMMIKDTKMIIIVSMLIKMPVIKIIVVAMKACQKLSKD